jgi:hypothetical protein
MSTTRRTLRLRVPHDWTGPQAIRAIQRLTLVIDAIREVHGATMAKIDGGRDPAQLDLFEDLEPR